MAPMGSSPFRGKRRRYAIRWNRLLTAFSPLCHKSSKTLMLRSRKVEAIQVNHLIPGRDKVVNELLLRVGTSVNFREGPELGV